MFIAIWCWNGKTNIDIKVAEQKAEIQLYDNVIEYSSTFTFDKETIISESAVVNENGVTLDIDNFSPLPIREWSSITITHTITFDNERKKIAII